MRILRVIDRRPMPWKNGGGSTTEIAIGPAGASLDAFDWRISMAQVASDGPFSMFDGIDRTLTVITGGGMELTIGDQAPVVLGTESEPLSFPGDVPTIARPAGEITDLNVMTRRGRFTHRVARVTQPMSCKFDSDDIVFVLSVGGTTEVSIPHEQATLEHADAALIVSSETTSFQIIATGGCYLIWLKASAE